MSLKMGIDLGGTKIYAVVLDAENKVVASAKKKTRPEKGVDSVIARIVEVVHGALEGAGATVAELATIGIGAPGLCDRANGVVLHAPNLNWNDVPLVARLRESIDKPIGLANDVDAGTWGEFRLGAAREDEHAVGVFIGTGIGGGLVLNGKLYSGNGVAGEIGHMMLTVDGPLCSCGRRGCMEAWASRSGMTRQFKKRIKDGTKSLLKELVVDWNAPINSRILLEAYGAGDGLTVEIIERSAMMVGYALGSVANLLNPDCFVLGGGVVEAFGKEYLKKVKKAYPERVLDDAKGTRIVEAELGDDAGAVGAALLAEEGGAIGSAPVAEKADV